MFYYIYRKKVRKEDIMKCFYHTNRDAVSQCPKCNKGLCKECLNSEGNLCRDCELEEQEQLKEEAAASEKEKEVKMRKKSYYILASLVGFFIFGFIVLSPINSFDQFLQVLIFTFCFGSMPSGWRIMTRITQNKIIPDTFSDLNFSYFDCLGLRFKTDKFIPYGLNFCQFILRFRIQ